MFKPRRVIFIALRPFLLCAPPVLLETSSRSLPQAKSFAEGVINTDADEYGPAFTPGGKTPYFTRRVNRRDSEFIYAPRLKDWMKWIDVTTHCVYTVYGHLRPKGDGI